MTTEPPARGPDPLGALGLRLRPMGPDLAGALVRFHGGLSLDTTRRRFFTVHPELTPVEVARFTDVDHDRREALVALDGDDRIVAVARFDRLGPSAPVAEVAFVVADEWQHRGLGRALFDHLAARARRLGVERFVADTLPENRAMRAVFHHAGLPWSDDVEHGVVRTTIDLAPAGGGARPAQLLGGGR